MAYFSLEDVCTTALPEPDVCDALTVVYKGVTLHVSGFLHGITGAGNKKYKAFIQKSILASTSPVLIEKGYSSIYSGTIGELEDWAPLPFWYTFSIPGRFLFHPKSLAILIYGLLTERATQTDRFSVVRKFESLGDSPSFHLLEPYTRRALCGFPSPDTYLKLDLDRRLRPLSPSGRPVKVPDHRWDWIETLEPSASIPLRSLHMLEFATAYAQAKGCREISLFVGETHNTDIAWLAEHLDIQSPSWSIPERTILTAGVHLAQKMGKASAEGQGFKKERFGFEFAFGAGFVSTLLSIGSTLLGTVLLSKKVLSLLPKKPKPDTTL